MEVINIYDNLLYSINKFKYILIEYGFNGSYQELKMIGDFSKEDLLFYRMVNLSKKK